jgi:hypothetical protein
MSILNKRGQPTKIVLNKKRKGNSNRKTDIIMGRWWLTCHAEENNMGKN